MEEPLALLEHLPKETVLELRKYLANETDPALRDDLSNATTVKQIEKLFRDAMAEIQREIREAIAEIRAEGLRRAYAVANQKGGAGKTTTAVTLAAVWASWGLRVRLIDCDPQSGSATVWLPSQYPEGSPRYTLRDVYLGRCTLDEATYPTTVPNLYIVPSDITLNEIEKTPPPGSELALKLALADSEFDVDIDILDTNPSLGTLTVSGMAGSNEVLIPVGASGLDLPGLTDLAGTMALVKKRLNPGMSITAVIVTDNDDKTLLSQDVHERLVQDYPHALHAQIPGSIRVREAPFAFEPITTFVPKNPATLAYVELGVRLLVPRPRKESEEESE